MLIASNIFLSILANFGVFFSSIISASSGLIPLSPALSNKKAEAAPVYMFLSEAML